MPRDAWQGVLEQLAHRNQAGQDLAEARERAARAETEATFLRERLAELRADRDRPSTAAPSPAASAAATSPAVARELSKSDPPVQLVERRSWRTLFARQRP